MSSPTRSRRLVFAKPKPLHPRLRVAPDRFDRYANEHQRSLVNAYNAWGREATQTVVLAREAGVTPDQAVGLLKSRVPELIGQLRSIGRSRIAGAASLGLGKALRGYSESPRVKGVLTVLSAQSDTFLEGSLQPQIEAYLARPKTLQALSAADPILLRRGMKVALRGLESTITPYSGASVVAIFETQRAAGAQLNQDRHGRGEGPVPVRWVLDLGVTAHCRQDMARGTYGCPDLERVYPNGWAQLPTVPAGHVSCLGNCRCRIEVDFGNGWERVA